MGDETPTKPPASKREKGPATVAMEAADAAARRSEERDARQDARTDKAWQAALDAERFTKRVFAALLALSILANIVLVAMVVDAKLEVEKDSIRVGGD